MKMVSPSLIRNIDEYAIGTLGVGARALMERSGHAVADAVRARVARGSKVVVLAGKGNNGGDGYAAALELMRDYAVAVCDVFGAGQRSEEGKFFLAAYLRAGGEIRSLPDDPDFPARLNEADCIVDAIFGTGFCGELPEELRPLALALRRAAGVEKIAIDLPLGVNAEDGSVSDVAASFGATVELTFPKRGVVSYPARSCAGALIFADLGLPLDEIAEHFSLKDRYIDFEDCAELLPEREENSHKGSFGKLLVVTGSELYRGAADLSLSAALRGGCGSVTFLGSEKLCGALAAKYPEALYRPADLSEGRRIGQRPRRRPGQAVP